MTEARSKMEVIDTEAKCLKEILNKAKAGLALEKKKRRVAEAKVTEVEKKAEGQIVEDEYLVIEAFWALQEFFDVKVKFDEKIFITGQDVCYQKIKACFLNLDLAFLDEEEEEEADEDLVSDPTMAEEQSDIRQVAKMPTLAATKAASLSMPPQPIEESEQPAEAAPNFFIDPQAEIVDT